MNAKNALWLSFFLLFLDRANAQQWQPVNEIPAGQTTSLWVVDDTIYAAGLNKLYVSADEGSTWDSTATIFPALDYIVALRYAQGRLYVGTVDDGVYSSADGGQNWQDFEPALSGSYGYDIAFCNGSLYSARSNGLWRIALTTSAEEPTVVGPMLGQNFPNPFADRTIIPFTLLRPGRVELAVFNAVGQRVATLWCGEKGAGAHTLTWETGHLPTGAYVYRLTTNFGTVSGRMLLVR